FCRQVNMPVLGIVENMSGFICPHCGKRTDLFKCGGGKRIAEEMGEPFLGSIPIDPSVVESCDEGIPALVKKPKNEVAKAFKQIVKIIIQKTKEKAPPNLPPERKRSKE
ncbi:MAG: Mrp/NBP35 family ATP-binding protein, partial [Candidatus Aminicenantes bacterium]|nr:Mrp/NBP35 family ATP-binding protein [Candidatus Aminicenantes bacterium]